MSCSFWLRRKRLAAQKQKEAATVSKAEEKVVEQPVVTEETKETPKKTAKKAVKSSDNTAD